MQILQWVWKVGILTEVLNILNSKMQNCTLYTIIVSNCETSSYFKVPIVKLWLIIIIPVFDFR